MLSDLRFALRQLAKTPGFTAIVVLTLALAIGACTAIYSALDSIVLRPFDDPDTARNVVLRSVQMPQGIEASVSDPDFHDIARQAKSFEFVARSFPSTVIATGIGDPVRLRRMNASERWFDVFGVRMALGRAFRPEEFVRGNTSFAILSHGTWQRLFGGAPDVIDKVVLIDDVPRTIVGVTPEHFERSAQSVEIWHPYPPERGTSQGRDVRAMRDRGTTTGRLRPGATLEQAQAELDTLAAALAQQYPETNVGFGIKALRTLGGGEERLPVMVATLFAAVGCLLLIACANVATLLLVRANARQREMSVRAALGGTRWQLLRQLLTESLLLALIGGAAGVLLAQWAVDFIRTSLPSGVVQAGLARLTYLQLDGGVVLFAVGLSVLTAVVFGLAPAWLPSSADVYEVVKQAGRGNSEGRSRGRLRCTLIVVEIAVAVTLLACTGLLIRSFAKATAHHPGFSTSDVTVIRMQLSRGKYRAAEAQSQVTTTLLAGLQNLPGIDLASISDVVPLSSWSGRVSPIEVQGAPGHDTAERPTANFMSVSPDHFKVMRIPLKRGRFFTERDNFTAPRVTIINETLARQHFGETDPIGRRIRLGSENDAWREVVGVVGDITLGNVGEAIRPQLFDPTAQRPEDGFVFMLHSKLPLGQLIALVKKQVQMVDPDLPLGAAMTMETSIRHKYTAQRLTLQLLTAFAVIALLVAALGIYSVIAFSVAQRTLEIGIRMALGANARDVVRLVLRQGAWMVGIGIFAGVVATVVSGRALESQLYQTHSHDPLTLIAITLLFAAVAALACWLPARRATKVDPMVALRGE
jgi:predicted permease